MKWSWLLKDEHYRRNLTNFLRLCSFFISFHFVAFFAVISQVASQKILSNDHSSSRNALFSHLKAFCQNLIFDNCHITNHCQLKKNMSWNTKNQWIFVSFLPNCKYNCKFFTIKNIFVFIIQVWYRFLDLDVLICNFSAIIW